MLLFRISAQLNVGAINCPRGQQFMHAKAIRDRLLVFPWGYRDREKIVCMRKIAEINCLPQKCI